MTVVEKGINVYLMKHATRNQFFMFCLILLFSTEACWNFKEGKCLASNSQITLQFSSTSFFFFNLLFKFPVSIT